MDGKYIQQLRDSRRASSITTRIKTLIIEDLSNYTLYQLAEHLPLQQGLRHSVFFPTDNKIDSRRASSITTRIKTCKNRKKGCRGKSRRASSITTRIKTHSLSPRGLLLPGLAEHLPLQQGLRRTLLLQGIKS